MHDTHTHVYFLSVHTEHLAREQLLGYLAVEENKKKSSLIYCSWIARCSTTKLYEIANGSLFLHVFVSSIVHLQFFFIVNTNSIREV